MSNVTKINSIEQQKKELAQEFAICKLEPRLRNHEDAYNGFAEGSIEHDCADKFFYGYEAAGKGEPLVEGFGECFKRGHAAYQPVIGSK